MFQLLSVWFHGGYTLCFHTQYLNQRRHTNVQIEFLLKCLSWLKTRTLVWIPSTFTHTRTHTHARTYTHIRTRARTYTHIRAHAHTCTYARTRARTHTQTHACTHKRARSVYWCLFVFNLRQIVYQLNCLQVPSRVLITEVQTQCI